MQNRYRIVLVLVIACLQPFKGGAQSTNGRWSLGLHGGANMWFNDMNTRKVGEGGEMYLRYGLSPRFSLGLQGGYEELKGEEIPVRPPDFPNDYLKLRAGHASLVGWFHLSPGKKFAPYIYVGGGVMVYRGVNGLDLNFPDTKRYVSLHIPIGVGFESFLGKGASFTMEASGRILDDQTDFFKYQAPDWYVSVKAGFNFYFGASDQDDDDADGLTNAQEAVYGTDPKKADSDQDVLKDGEEVGRYKTDPMKPDTDGDGLTDGDEVQKYGTDPTQADTDGDKLSDGDEVNKHGTDPLKIDTDGDTLVDGDEVLKYSTDPLKTDTDGDGLSDWEEVKVYKTNPAKIDSDGDGLTDGEEVHKYKTDPAKTDTDGGGVADGSEVVRKTNPLDSRDDSPGNAPLVLESGKRLVLVGVNFVSGSAKLLKNSEKTLERAYNALVANPSVKLDIVGHTDSQGSAEMNLALSVRRAQSVKAWLVKKGIAVSRLRATGRGMDEPIDSNTTAEGRANNRRIEFRVK